VGAAHLAFEVDDIDQAYNDLTRKGVRFVSPPRRSGNVKGCYFEDPDGITLELLQHGVTGP
jgi:catechol 2,3-dioxygenase-like lactoylglutathione lyase family enzyme